MDINRTMYRDLCPFMDDLCGQKGVIKNKAIL